ncbi:MAG: hypothetical protein JOY71_14150 [Acetobacteraceae bacterium]|nr:hypothetical protein [Acetobacteraceae bacterium]MBV8523243.1 hypothetical protein [Acetobacteraceae bacterium]MBV8590085.1 hypothetical protein [Acetobacteraceae bacterium]
MPELSSEAHDHRHHLDRLLNRLPRTVRRRVDWILEPDAIWFRIPLGVVLTMKATVPVATESADEQQGYRRCCWEGLQSLGRARLWVRGTVKAADQKVGKKPALSEADFNTRVQKTA